jgi:hypothetical protein
MQRLFQRKKAENPTKNIPLTDNYSIAVPEKFICSISFDLIEIPVMATDGKTYDAFNLIEWFATGSMRSPLTNTMLKKTLILNTLLYQEIREFYESCLLQDEKILQNDTHEKARTILKKRIEGLSQNDHNVREIQRYCKRNKIELHGFDVALPKKNSVQAENKSTSYKEFLKDAIVLLSEYFPGPSEVFFTGALAGVAGSVCALVLPPFSLNYIKALIGIPFSTAFTWFGAKIIGDFNRREYLEAFLTSHLFSYLQTFAFREGIMGYEHGDDNELTELLKVESVLMLIGAMLILKWSKPQVREHFGFFPERRAEDDGEIIEPPAAEVYTHT